MSTSKDVEAGLTAQALAKINSTNTPGCDHPALQTTSTAPGGVPKHHLNVSV